jgi:hypothetical protein
MEQICAYVLQDHEENDSPIKILKPEEKKGHKALHQTSSKQVSAAQTPAPWVYNKNLTRTPAGDVQPSLGHVRLETIGHPATVASLS